MISKSIHGKYKAVLTSAIPTQFSCCKHRRMSLKRRRRRGDALNRQGPLPVASGKHPQLGGRERWRSSHLPTPAEKI